MICSHGSSDTRNKFSSSIIETVFEHLQHLAIENSMEHDKIMEFLILHATPDEVLQKYQRYIDKYAVDISNIFDGGELPDDFIQGAVKVDIDDSGRVSNKMHVLESETELSRKSIIAALIMEATADDFSDKDIIQLA